MAKALFVIYLTTLSIGLTTAYAQECAAGPEYWCKSFENAQDCGAIRHCTDTVWSYDAKSTLVDSSKTCQLCEKILANTYDGIKLLGDNKDLIKATIVSGCKILPSSDLSSKCTNALENYETSVISLMQLKRFATLCNLMDICSDDKSSVRLGQKRCTWGPSYWCSSLSNSRECNSIDHCSNQIWSQQAIEKKQNDNICKYCEYTIDKLRSYLNDNKTEINIEKWLTGACSMLKTKDVIDECVRTMSEYSKEILILINNNIDSGIICHLGQMCKEATIIPRVKPTEKEPEVIDEQSKMLCNVIVRATHELYVNKKQLQSEIQTFLKNDCQQLSTSKLIQKCEDLVDRHGNEIYGHVANNMELSQVCDYVTDSTALESLPHVHCQLCTFVLTTTKYMLDSKQSADKVLLYIDEQLCARLNTDSKANCKYMIDTNGEELIENIQSETSSMLLCTYFQVCIDEITDKTSLIQKNEMRSFLKEKFCGHLGIFEDSCNALMEKDTTRLLKSLMDDTDGDVLCQMFGICPTKMTFIDNLSVNDDKNKCKRCIDDFTRRKHIAERLVNHSSEFLHHFCGQLPQADDCTKTVDDSINKLIQFIQSLNPEDICTELKLCNETLLKTIEAIQITSSDNIISQEVMVYIKNEICNKIRPLSKLCNQLIDSEGANLFGFIAKNIDPHKVCRVMDICSKSTEFESCDDKCDCCVNKIENYQVQLAAFLETILTTANIVCEHMPNSEECRQTADGFKSNIDEIISSFDAQRVCQALSHCSATSDECENVADKCQCCQDITNVRQDNFRTTINEITTNLLSLCTENKCRSLIQSNQQQTLNQLDKLSSLTICQRFGYCSIATEQRSIPFLSQIITDPSSINEIADELCSEFGDLKPICGDLITSSESARYAKVYMALLKNNSTIIDEDLRREITDTCDGCKNAVQASKDSWMNALESVRNVLLQTCEHCPSKDQCQNFINQRFDKLKSYVDQINPQQFCQTIHLCSVSLTDSCSICTERLQLRKDGVLQAVDRLTGYFNDLCQQHAGKECQIYANKIHASIQKSIEEFDSKETCSLIGFCTTDGVNNEMDFDQYEEYLEDEIEKNICTILGPFETLCKQVIHGDTKEIQALKINYDIKDLMQIGEELKTDDDECTHDKCQCCIARVARRKRHIRFVGDKLFCSLIRSCDRCPVKQQCVQHWKRAQARFHARIDHICPKRVCIHFGVCNKSSEKTIEVKQIDNSNSTCILCEYVMNILSNYIHSNATEDEIEENLQLICNRMPTILQNQCRDYIDNYGPSIIAILLRDFDLSTICHKLNLCTNQMKINIQHIIQANTATCGICDYISTYLHYSFQRNLNEKSFQHSLSTVCSHLSDEQKPKCEIIIQLFSPYIRQLELGSENNFCKQLTICRTPMIELQPAITKQVSKEKDQPLLPKSLNETPQCTLCHYVISYLDAILKNNKSEQAVEEALDKVCTILPSKERTECEEFVKTYGPTIAELIADTADPLTICRYLGMCPDSSAKKSTVDYVREQTPYTCTICQYIINRMKYFINLNQDEKEVIASLEASCDLFTGATLKEECKDFLHQRGAYFARIVPNDMEPKLACQNIGICDGNKQKSTVTPSAPVVSSTTYGKCIFGMKFWCTSRENAKLCNAMEVCERQVWSQKKPVIY